MAAIGAAIHVFPSGAAYSLSNRLRQAGQVTTAPGGSAQLDLAPGSAEQSAMRQFGVTA